jgi:hypothetical protein
MRRVSIAVAALLVAAGAFVYRFNALDGPLGGFDNDHFAHLVRAVHLVDGELPLRDYADAELRAMWPPLTYATSAAAQVVLGETLRSEAILTVGLLALGAAVTLWGAARLAQATFPALLVTMATVGLGPKLYNYPKVVVYAIAVILMVTYARRPTVLGLLPLAALTAVGTLYRHDHGVFLALSCAALIMLVRPPSPLRSIGVFSLIVTLGLLPGIVFVQWNVGLLEYVRKCLALSRQEAARTTTEAVFPSIDWREPLLAQADPRGQRPRLNVRWVAGLTREAQAERERALGLENPVARSEERNWTYELRDWSPQSLEAIVRDGFVEDTDGVDRRTFMLSPPADGSLWTRWQRRVPFLRWRIAPGVLHEGNAVPWLYVVAWGVVLVSLASSLVPGLTRKLVSPGVPPAALGAIAVMGLLMLVVYLRNPIPARLPDVSVPVAVLGAWLMATISRAVRFSTRPRRIAVNGLLTILVFLTMLGVGSAGAIAQELNVFGFSEGTEAIASHWRNVWANLGSLPDSVQEDDSKFGKAIAYIRRCTMPDDRLLVGNNAPELNYFSDRRFAAGQLTFFSNFYTAEEDQRLAIRRWQRQSIPVALIQPPGRFEEEFGADYPLLAAYLQAEYRRVGSLDLDGGVMDVWVESRRQVDLDTTTGLPCPGGASN